MRMKNWADLWQANNPRRKNLTVFPFSRGGIDHAKQFIIRDGFGIEVGHHGLPFRIVIGPL